MEILSTSDELRERLADWRDEGDHIALIPTMGNIHDGHLSLVRIAREHAERVVVSIFVNPKQFASPEEYDDYPRTFERDKRRLDRENVDLIFVPDEETIYPFGVDSATTITVPALSDQLCGSFRPEHFDGYTTAVTRLFGLVQPDVAVFGQKNYQAQLVISRMTTDLRLPIKVICGPTVRDEHGLALSSRNRLLSEDEQSLAPKLHTVIDEISHDLANGQREFEALEQQGIEKLAALGFKPEYVSIRRAENLGEPDRDCDELVVLASVWLGEAHLIDNQVVHI